MGHGHGGMEARNMLSRRNRDGFLENGRIGFDTNWVRDVEHHCHQG